MIYKALRLKKKEKKKYINHLGIHKIKYLSIYIISLVCIVPFFPPHTCVFLLLFMFMSLISSAVVFGTGKCLKAESKITSLARISASFIKSSSGVCV